MRRDLVLAAALLASPLMLSADEKLDPGCKAGDGIPAFAVVDVTGQYKTQTLCYI